MYELTTQLASFVPPPPHQIALLRSLIGNQAKIDRFLGVLTGSMPVAEFCSPPNLLRILGPIGTARLILGSAWARPRLARA